MADSAPTMAAKEHHEAADVVERKAQTLADLIRNSKHFIAFTGAGISTSAGKCTHPRCIVLTCIPCLLTVIQAFPTFAVLKVHGR